MDVIINYKDKSEKIFENVDTAVVIKKEYVEVCLSDGSVVQTPIHNVKDLQVVFSQENDSEEDSFEGFEELSDDYV